MIIFPFLSDGFTFVKRHQAALIQRLKSVEPLFEHLRDQNVLSMYIFKPSSQQTQFLSEFTSVLG